MAFRFFSETTLSARQKLNGAVLTGAVMMAAIVWAFTGSGGLAVVVAAILLVAGLSNGSYRADAPPSGYRPRRRRR